MWDSFPKKWKLHALWNEYMLPPWNNWSIGLFDGMLTTPSQQAHESWHKQILQSRIPGMFKGSTEHVFAEAIPELVKMDGILIPDALQFHVEHIPVAMFRKAHWYSTKKDTHLFTKMVQVKYTKNIPQYTIICCTIYLTIYHVSNLNIPPAEGQRRRLAG